MTLWDKTYSGDTIRVPHGDINAVSFIHDCDRKPTAQIQIRAHAERLSATAYMDFHDPAQMREVAQMILTHADRLEALIAQGADAFEKAA